MSAIRSYLLTEGNLVTSSVIPKVIMYWVQIICIHDCRLEYDAHSRSSSSVGWY